MDIAQNEFNPPAVLRNPYIQSLLASKNFRSWGSSPVKSTAKKTILTIDNSVRLLAYLSANTQQTPKGIVIFLHGWEGSVDSSYILTTSTLLFQMGYSVIRINFRDHGRSHHLNKGLFFASKLNEVFQAVKISAQSCGMLPAFLIGFSLGGNFALRIALHCQHESIKNLKHVLAISPVLNPNKTTSIIDNTTFIRNYFLKKWRRSLSIKQCLYPQYYHFEDILKLNTIREITDKLIRSYSDFLNATTYFNAYTINRVMLQTVQIPTTIITSMDDPIIPIDEFSRLSPNETLHLAIQRFGGHNGFIGGWSLKSWCAPQIVRLFDGIVQQESN